MSHSIQLNFDKRVATLFLSTLIAVGGIAYNVRTSAQTAAPALPTSGTCALLMTLPIPYGFDVASNVSSNNVRGALQTGYNLIGQLTFLNSTSGKFSGRVVNPTFNSADSPFIAEDGGVTDINDMNVTISPMSSSNGFSGGYLFSFSGSLLGKAVGFTLTGVSANSGKTIMLASTGSGQSNHPGLGPGSGLCQV